jgi:hypothetical protein
MSSLARGLEGPEREIYGLAFTQGVPKRISADKTHNHAFPDTNFFGEVNLSMVLALLGQIRRKWSPESLADKR